MIITNSILLLIAIALVANVAINYYNMKKSNGLPNIMETIMTRTEEYQKKQIEFSSQVKQDDQTLFDLRKAEMQRRNEQASLDLDYAKRRNLQAFGTLDPIANNKSAEE